MTDPPLLYRDGCFYDAVMRDDLGDVAFIRDLVLRRPGPALELACGTGRLTIPWAQAGCDATGIDSAPALLDRARQKAAAAGVRVRFVEGDMRRFDLRMRFATIVLAGDSVGHLHDDRALAACLECVRNHLAPGGAFVLDAPIPEERLLRADDAVRRPWAAFEHPTSGRRGEFGFRSRYDAATGVLTLATDVAYDGGRIVAAGVLSLRLWREDELRAGLRAAGLEPVECFGNYHGAPPNARSPRSLLVCCCAEDARRRRLDNTVD